MGVDPRAPDRRALAAGVRRPVRCGGGGRDGFADCSEGGYRTYEHITRYWYAFLVSK